jgi:excisionase family DNA binding protein
MNKTQTNSTSGRQAAVAERLLNVREVAARFGVSGRQVWKLVASGRLCAPVRLGRSVRWRESDIDEFIRLGCPSVETFEAAKARQGGGR